MTTKLINAAQIILGQSPPSTSYNKEGIGLPFFQGKAEFTDLYPVAKKWCSNPKKIAEPGNILISVRAPVGSTNLANQKCCIGRGLAAINYKGPTKFLLYYFRLIESDLDKLGTGSTFNAISGTTLKNIKIPYPPLPEQHAIVERIEELFSELDKGIENLKQAQQQLKTYRQSVLKWAFEGKLTEAWRQKQGNLTSPEKILKGIKDERQKFHKLPFEDDTNYNLEIPGSWSITKSGDLFSYVTSGSRGWAKYYSDSGALFIRITNLNFNTLELDLADDKLQYVSLPANIEGSRTRIIEGDFLFSITGYLGMFAIAPDLKEAYVNQHIALARPIENINIKYFGYFITSESGGIRELNKLRKGATKAGLTLSDIKNFPVPLPSIDEQQEIVTQIESRLLATEDLQNSINHNLEKAESLRQSILKMAFDGRLTEKWRKDNQHLLNTPKTVEV